MKTAQQSSSKKTTFAVLIFGLFAIATLLSNTTTFAQEEGPFQEGIRAEDVPEAVLYAEEPPAQEKVSLTAIPPRLGEDSSLKAFPGEKLQVQLRVRNLSDQTVNIVTTPKDFIIGDDGETPIAIDDSTSNRWSLASWLTIAPAENIIAPKETIGLNVLIEIPDDALPGGHYAMILHQPNKNSADYEIEGSSQSAVSQRVGTLLYVIVDGAINEEAYVRNFEFPNFTEYGPVPFSYTVENNSDIHIAPQMNVEITNIFNQKVDDIQISSKNVFPLDSRDFEGEWRRVWGWGLYKARLTASFGTNGSIVIANTSFWLLPIKLIIAGLVGLLIIAVLIVSVKRHLSHRRNDDKNKIAELENQIQEMSSQGGGQDDTPQL